MNEKNLKGIFVGGPGPTKLYFLESSYLHHEVQKKVLDVFDTGYTDETGLRELVNLVAKKLENLKISHEKKIMDKFFKEIVKKKDSMAIYGEEEVRNALEKGAVQTLLLSEDLKKYRVKLRCNQCGYNEERTVDEKEIEKLEKQCKKCGGAMVIENKLDLVEELSKKAKERGTKVELISTDSEEGQALLTTFGGVAGILRYRL